MQTIRRLYLYAVAFVSLLTVLWGVIGLARSIFSGQEIGGSVDRLAGALALLVVGVPVFLLHWGLAQRQTLRDPEERSARLRAIFLYGVLLATLIPVVQNFLALVNRLLIASFGLDPAQAFIGVNQIAADNLIAILCNGVAAAYFFTILRSDWRLGPRGDDYAETRRLYRYIWLIYSLALVVFGVQQTISYVLASTQLTGSGTAYLLANGLVLLAAGLPLWIFTERLIQRSLEDTQERNSLLRLILLYVLTFISVIAVLGSSAQVLYQALQWALGEPFTFSGFLGESADMLAVAVAFGLVWIYYARSLDELLKGSPESTSSAATERGTTPLAGASVDVRRLELRRLYYYVLAALGLGATFIGLDLLVGFILDMAFSSQSAWGSTLREQVSAALAALIVGLPLWLVAWRPMQREASREGESGDLARRSGVRKGYLFLALFVGVMGVMFAGGVVIYELLKALLGNPGAALLLTLLQELKTALLFALLLAFHWAALQADGRMAERALARRYAQFPVLILVAGKPEAESGAETPEDPLALELVNALQREAPALPVAVHRASQGAPDETLSAARVVILPTELMTRPSEALRVWLQGFNGTRLLLPTQSKGWLWLFGGGRSLASLARQAADTVRLLAEGREAPVRRETPTWMVLVYIFASLFALELIVGLISLAISFFANR